jgi:hypothetical protein
MKTFKLVSLQLLPDNQNPTELNILDGLIINKENEANTWLIEALVDYDHFHHFEEITANRKELTVSCIITKKDNIPAYFDATITGVRKMEGFISILLRAKLRNRRREIAEFLLDTLVDEGYNGEELKQAFKDGLRESKQK